MEVGSLAEANNEFITPLFPDSVVSLQDPLEHLLASTKKEVLGELERKSQTEKHTKKQISLRVQKHHGGVLTC